MSGKYLPVLKDAIRFSASDDKPALAVELLGLEEAVEQEPWLAEKAAEILSAKFSLMINDEAEELLSSWKRLDPEAVQHWIGK